MRDIYEVLKEKQITLPQPPPKEGCIHPYRNLVKKCCIVQVVDRSGRRKYSELENLEKI